MNRKQSTKRIDITTRPQRSVQKLRVALLELMNEVSIEDLTVVNICKRANVNRMSFYRYYIDKYALLSDMMQTYLLAMEKELCKEFLLCSLSENQYFDFDEKAFLLEFIRKLVNFCDLYENQYKILASNSCMMAQNLIEKYFSEECERIFNFCINMRVKGVNPNLVCSMFKGSVITMLKYRLLQTEKTPKRSLFRK